ncbi:MAG: stage II sporulation protein R [Defluviitaleaceae bacterium]|nr:stage II sporulation protein R [Defluviitaleaceae bacterium]
MSDKLRQTLMGEAKILMISFGAGFVCMLVFAVVTQLYAADAQEDVASEIVRFHVLAHSDSDSEQELKLRVRDAVLERYSTLMHGAQDREQSIELLRAELGNIENIAAQVVAKAGLDHDVEAGLHTGFFPTRAYGEIRLPPGMYKSLTIRIGDAIGKNWWCVVFPPLCFVDEAQAEVSDTGRERFADLMSDSAYDLVSQSESDTGVRVRFAVVEWWQNRSAGDPGEILIVKN